MAPTQHFAVSPNSHTSELPSHRRWPALLLVLVVLVGSLTTACSASDEKLVSALSTTDQAETRQKKAAELAERHSLDATQALAAAAVSNPTATAGLAALRDEYIALLNEEPKRELSDKQVTALSETVDCLAAIGDADAIAALAHYAATPQQWVTAIRVHAVQALAGLQLKDVLDSLVGLVAIHSGEGSEDVRAAAVAPLLKHPEAATGLVEVHGTAGAQADAAIDGLLVGFGAPGAEALVAKLSAVPQETWIPSLLCEVGTSAIPAIGPALGDTNAAVRMGVLDALLCLRVKDAAAVDAVLATPEHVPVLIEGRTQTQSTEQGATLEEILLVIGEPAVGPLIAVLGETNWTRGLLTRFGVVAGPQLEAALGSGDATVSARALRALLDFYAISPEQAAPFLVKAERVPLLIDTLVAQESQNSGVNAVLVAIGQPAVSGLVARASQMLTDSAGWTDRQQAKKIYDLIFEFDHGLSTNALVDAVAQGSLNRLHVLFLAVKLGIPGSEAQLNELLMQVGDVAMAEDYLNSGSNLLYQGGEQWATSRGYYIEEGPGSSRTSWGQF